MLLRSGHEKKTKERALEREDILKMLDRSACKSERDEALILFDAASGLRQEELAGLNVGDLVFEDENQFK